MNYSENIIYGNLYIQNTNLTDLSNFSNINKVIGTIYIENNKRLLNTIGLSDITYMQNLIIQNNDVLYDLDFRKVIFIEGNVIINNNDKLNNLDGLSNLVYIGGSYDDCIYNKAQYFNYGDLIINNNTNLNNINGLSKIHTINGNLLINTHLKDVCIFKNLNCVHYKVNITNNDEEFLNIDSLLNCNNNLSSYSMFIIVIILSLLFIFIVNCCLSIYYIHKDKDKDKDTSKMSLLD